MYNYVWFSLGVGVFILISGLFLLLKDSALVDKFNRSSTSRINKLIFVSPNILYLIVGIGWLAMGVLLYLAFQQQLSNR